MNPATQQTAPELRVATLDDYERIARHEAACGLVSMPREDWRRLWLDNPLWPRLSSDWPVGWLLEDADCRVVGSMVNIPSLYTFRGRELICANGRGWAVAPEFRGFALWVMSEYFQQSGADLFINTTVAPIAEPKIAALSDRVPVGDFQTIVYWVTGYRGFARKALEKLRVPGASMLAWPLAAALAVRDTIRARRLPRVPASFVIDSVASFDARFDAFWDELRRRQPDTLLGVRDSRTLAWHFGGLLRAGRLWIFTAQRQGLLRAYAIFRRQDRGADGIRRMQLVDYQSLESDVDLLPGLLRAALNRSQREGFYVLEQVGCELPRQSCVDACAPYRRRLPCWPYYFRAPDPELHAELSAAQVWAPSLFDGDASFD